jgi:hypothetical protein
MSEFRTLRPARTRPWSTTGTAPITLRTAVTGVPEEVTLSDGTVAIKDVGRIVSVSVIDYNGAPTDVEDDVFLFQTIESTSGPHPKAESGFTLFCEVVVPALTSPPEAGTQRGARSALGPDGYGNCWSSHPLQLKRRCVAPGAVGGP